MTQILKGKPNNEPKGKDKGGSKGQRRAIRILWITFITGFVAFGTLVWLINNGLVGYMPTMAELENPQSSISSDAIAADGTLLGRYYVLDRSNSKFEDISPNVINALVATEDYRYYEHAGIDPMATLRVVFKLGKAGGGSTISQQLAKNLFPRTSHNFLTLALMKLKEWILAVKLERNLTKNEILTLYLNTVPFGDNVYGIRNASLTFYNKMPDKVSVDEAAVLIGMLKANTAFNPRIHPKRSRERRDVVLDLMYKHDKISQLEHDTLIQRETPLDYHKIDYHDGTAPYFRQVLEQEVKKVCKDLKKPDGTPYDIYKDGLKIYTTIDVKMQRYAEEAMQEHLTELQKLFLAQPGYKDGTIWDKAGNVQNILKTAIKSSDRYQFFRNQDMNETQAMAAMRNPIKMRVFAWNEKHYKDTVMSPIDSIKYMKVFLQAGFCAMDPFTGEVKAWVGGIDHNFFQYDHVNLNTKRQVGSTIKALLYCYAVDIGMSPCDNVSTLPAQFASMDHPYDADKEADYAAQVPMKRALAMSINNAALNTENTVGIEAFVDFIKQCGITSRIDKVPSAALGVADISLYEMLGAYSMFPSGGMNTQPYFITRIEDKNGMLIKNFAPVQKEIINPVTAYKMITMMRGVVNHGTGARMRFKYNIHSDIGGKTGTTSNQADAWFIGYTPQLLAGAWVGCDDREFRFRSERLGQGASAALPIWALFFKRLYADPTTNINEKATFKMPPGFEDCDNTDAINQAQAKEATEEVQESGGGEEVPVEE